jgi:CopG family nickel-responsive transcriptional regulator
MERITISLDDKLAGDFDALIASRGYENRSEAIRDLLRNELDRARRHDLPKGACIAALSYVFNHHELDLAERMTSLQHEHHDMTVSTMHVHLDHDFCLETVVLNGAYRDVKRFTDAVCAERGVRHGHANVISLEEHEPHAVKKPAGAAKEIAHTHRRGSGGKRHVHFKPVT